MKAHEVENWIAVRRLPPGRLVGGIVHDLADDDAARAAALAPIAQQDQAVYELLRDRRRVVDVDPTTGTPIAEAPSDAGVPDQPPG